MKFTWKDIHLWREKNIPPKYFILILAVFVGLLSGIAGAVIKNSVHLIQELLTIGKIKEYQNYFFFFYPFIGLYLTYWIINRVFSGKDVGHGIPNTLYAISKKNGIIKRLSMVNSIVTSAITVGFGGSVGLEGPTVATSAAIGSNIGRYFRVNYKTKTLLIACASAGALAAIFNAPVAAIVFAIEVIMIDLTTASLLPLLIASISATITNKLFFDNEVLFHFEITEGYEAVDILYYIVLGIVCGLFSIYFSKTYFYVSAAFKKIKTRRRKVLIGGALLGILVFFFPPLFGEGINTINLLIEGKYEEVLNNSLFYDYRNNFYGIILFLVAVLFFKAWATTITFGAGGVGGIFAPTLFMGSIIGFIYSKTINYFELGNLSETNFPLVAMAGLMAGILHAPLTAIFLIAEVTGGYELFLPLMLTSSIAFLTGKIAISHSVYTYQLAQRGELITHHKDKAVLTLMKLKNEIETDFSPVPPEASLRELVKIVSQSKRNLFPVLDKNKVFLGVVNLNEIREIMFNQEMYDTTFVNDLMTISPAQISVADNMELVMEKFENTGAWNLPVLDEGKYIGFVSKSKLFSAYRKLLQDFYQED